MVIISVERSTESVFVPSGDAVRVGLLEIGVTTARHIVSHLGASCDLRDMVQELVTALVSQAIKVKDKRHLGTAPADLIHWSFVCLHGRVDSMRAAVVASVVCRTLGFDYALRHWHQTAYVEYGIHGACGCGPPIGSRDCPTDFALRIYHTNPII